MTTPRRILRTVTPDTLSAYFADMRRRSVPTPEEERQLVERIRQGDDKALQDLIEGNLRFVVQVARKYQGHGLPLSDLINEGNLGLIHAAHNFDPTHGVRFITYAVRWIRQAIMHTLAKGGGAVRLPIRQAEALSKLRQKFEEIHQQKGAEPTAEDLADALDMEQEEVEALLRVHRPYLSLDTPIVENSEATLLDLLQSRALPSSEEAYVHASTASAVEALLGQLEAREAQILREYYGFEDEPRSLAEIGRELHLSRERVRQLEARARRKFHALAKEKALNHYLN
jgi:RNA polymerase primary sigma factor